MNGFLVDTNIPSELTKSHPSKQVDRFLRHSKNRVFISVFSIGEIRKGIACLPISNRRAGLEDWLDNEILPWFGNRILPVTLSIAERWGELSAHLRAIGRPRPVMDTVIAATALTHDLILVSRNVKDYMDTGLTVFNPWEEDGQQFG